MPFPVNPRLSHVPGHNGMPIAVWDYGGAGPPVLFCHCTGAVARVWDPVIAPLQHRFRAFAVDTRGHGDSGTPRSSAACAWNLCGLDLLAVIDALDLGNHALYAAGHSGGAAQVGYAALQRPDVFSRLVLADGIIGPRRFFNGPAPLAAGARRRRARFEDRAQARRRLGAKPPMNQWRPAALDAYLRHALRDEDGGVVLKCAPEVEAWMYEAGGACDLFERLDALAVESLLLTGNDRDIGTLVREQHRRLPRAELRVWPDTGHFLPQERPERFAGLLAEWLR